jgi:UDP-glucose 4-epimerase
MKILVTGGSGFLGSHVADQLTLNGHEVTIFDQVKSPWLKPGQKMIVGNVCSPEELYNVSKGVEVFYHLAALADLNESLEKPVKTVEVNVLGTVYALEACRKNKIKRFIYASTLYVYSQEGGFYRCSKQSAEHFVEEYQKAFGIDYTILRYGSLYGPRSTESNGLYRIVQEALKENVVRYRGHSESMREYVHVEDVSRASVHALADEYKNQSLLLTGQESMRVYDLVKMLAEILGIPDKVEFTDEEYLGHYVRTPYSYQPKLGRKYRSSTHVDLGQGLLQLIDEVRRVTDGNN